MLKRVLAWALSDACTTPGAHPFRYYSLMRLRLVGSVTLGEGRPIGSAGRIGLRTEILRTAQPLLQFLRTRCYNAFHEILHLFGPDGFLCGQPEWCELVHFCLFWQLISVTISRRSAAEGCADARTVPGKTASARRRHGEHIVRAYVSDGAAVVRGKCTPARLLARQQQQARRQHQQDEGGERRRQRQTHCASKPSEARVALLVTVFAAIS